MRYLHTMIRVSNLDNSLDFFCNKLGMKEVRRSDYESGRFTLVFLSADEDFETAQKNQSPCIELTYNWPDENGHVEEYTSGRNFGHLAFSVENIYDTCKELMDGGVDILRPPRDGYMAFIKSPCGISVELLQSGEPLAPLAPWNEMENQGSW